METKWVSQGIAAGLASHDVVWGVAKLREVMGKSEAHAVYVARKLALMDLEVGLPVRRLVMVLPAFAANPGNAWFPLSGTDVDKMPSLVPSRVKHMVTTFCMWYSLPKPLLADLTSVATECGGNVSWIWVEVAAWLANNGLGSTADFGTLRPFAHNLCAAIQETGNATGNPVEHYGNLRAHFVVDY